LRLRQQRLFPFDDAQRSVVSFGHFRPNDDGCRMLDGDK
jgi:hypothetical protein